MPATRSISKANEILSSEYGGLNGWQMSDLDKCANEFIAADSDAREAMVKKYSKTFNSALHIDETIESKVMQTVSAPLSMLDCSDMFPVHLPVFTWKNQTGSEGNHS
jgi:hypothetical protein